MGERRKQTLPKSINEDEFLNLMRHVKEKDKQTKLAFLLGFGSGLRISEIKNLKPEDVTDRIFVSQGKYSKDRIVPLPKGWKETYRLLLPIKKSPRSLQRLFKQAAQRAELDKRYTFHSLRHGFATHALKKGIPINHVQVLLGHSNVATTNVYIKANPEDALRKYEEVF